MPEGITEDEKAIIKRVVPAAQNKIQAAAMARLYIAYPNRSKWTYTGLQGAIVLANDLIGNTFWMKLVDVSVCQSTTMSLLTYAFMEDSC
jgi:Wiskott-Aldrich syndrome protein